MKKPDAAFPHVDPTHPLFGLGYSKAVRSRAFRTIGAGATESAQHGESRADIAEEVPVAIAYNGRPHVVMMCSPSDLEDFATGFSLSEQIVADMSQIRDMHVATHAQGIDVQITIAEAAAQQIESRSRQLIGRTGCGLCGVELIGDALRESAPVQRMFTLSEDALFRAARTLPQQQPGNQRTGTMHAAAFADKSGELLVVREDVGRHNALDKVIGALARAGIPGASGFFLVTSRASYEMVQKSVVAGVAIIAAISRPTGLAIRLAESKGVTLVGLVRDNSANIYAHDIGVGQSGATPDQL